MGGIFEVDGYEVSLGDDTVKRAEDDAVYANALRVVVRATGDLDTAGSKLKAQTLLAVAVAKLSNMTQEQLSWVSKLEDVIDPARILVGWPYGKSKPPLAFEDTPANREFYEEMVREMGEPRPPA